MASLHQKYKDEIVPILKERLGESNVMALPKLTKIVINMGPMGCKVTLRGKRMYDFVERLINVAIPRERDFRGLNPKSFDKQGNYSFGIKEQIIFPEINYDNIDQIRGMDICVNTSANNPADAKVLLEELNFPFKK